MTFDFETNSRWEPYLNYSFGFFTIVTVLLSTILNPLILHLRQKEKKSTRNFLLNVVAVSDFLRNLLPATFISYVFLSSIEFDQYKFFNQIPEFFCCTFGCISQCTATLMAITRMIDIIKPIYSIKFKWVLTYLTCYTIYMVLGNAGFLLYYGIQSTHETEVGSEKFTAVMTFLEMWNKYFCSVMNLFHCMLGILCSFITVAYHRLSSKSVSQYHNMNVKKNGEQALKLQESNTILIMNLVYVVSIVFSVQLLLGSLDLNKGLFSHYMIPIFTCGFNLLVVVTRTDILKKKIRRSVSQVGRLSKKAGRLSAVAISNTMRSSMRSSTNSSTNSSSSMNSYV